MPRAMGALFCLLPLGIALGLRELRIVLSACDDDEMMSGREGSRLNWMSSKQLSISILCSRITMHNID